MKNWLLVCLLVVTGCATQPVRMDTKELLFEANISQTSVEPGHALRLSTYSEDNRLEFVLKGFGQKLILQSILNESKYYEGFIAIPLDTVAGVYDITLQIKLDNEIEKEKLFSITVLPRSPFKTTKLSIKSFGKYDFASESKIMALARLEPVNVIRDRLDGFSWPVVGRISELFGVKRIYNNGLNSWYHGGLDIAAPGGTIISAATDGRVILVRKFEAHGNTTLINHGYGVITTYLHQKKIVVEEGAFVKQGQPIGEVGTTGSSTGNHLHFQVNINNIIVDPYDFIMSEFQNKQNKFK